MKVALTGGLSAGKSTVCGLFEKMGATVLSADRVVHDLLENDSAIIAKVVAIFGDEILVSGKIDRNRLAEKTFNHSEKRQLLEQVLHPAVRIYLKEAANRAKGLFVAEIPLLFEGGSTENYDVTVAVVAPDHLCKIRYQNRYPERGDYDKRVSCQISQKEKASRADYVIKNDGSSENLQLQVKTLWNALDKGERHQL